MSDDRIVRRILLEELNLSSDDPNYMAEYMRIKRKIENMEDAEKRRVKKELEDFRSRLFKLIL